MSVPTTLPGPTVKDDDFLRALAAALDARLAARGMTVADLVRATGLPHNTVSHYLAGRREPSLSAARKLCRGLGLTLAKLDQMLPPVDPPKEAADDAG